MSALGPAFIALNIKEPGMCQDLRKIIPRFNGFVFDFELCCSDPERELQEYKSAGYNVARRYSDQGEFPIGEYDFVWLDEMRQSNSLQIPSNLRNIIYVSPELHGRSITETRPDWTNFAGVCADFCDYYTR